MADTQGVLRIVAIDSAHASDPDSFEYPHGNPPEFADQPVWGVYEYIEVPDEDGGYWDEVESGLTLSAAQSL